MKPIELTSTLVAAIFGAVLLLLIVGIVHMLNLDDSEGDTNYALILAAGAVVGAGVQVGVRVTGVS